MIAEVKANPAALASLGLLPVQRQLDGRGGARQPA